MWCTVDCSCSGLYFLVEVEERLPRMISKTEAQATCKSSWRCELMPDLWRPMRSTWQHGRNMLKHAETNGPWPMTSIAVWDHSIEVEGDQPCWRAQAIICMKACQGHASSWSLAFWQPISPPEDEDGWIPRAYVAELHSWTSIRANNANAFALLQVVSKKLTGLLPWCGGAEQPKNMLKSRPCWCYSIWLARPWPFCAHSGTYYCVLGQLLCRGAGRQAHADESLWSNANYPTNYANCCQIKSLGTVNVNLGVGFLPVKVNQVLDIHRHSCVGKCKQQIRLKG